MQEVVWKEGPILLQRWFLFSLALLIFEALRSSVADVTDITSDLNFKYNLIH
jgi:hypothetical protein